MPDAPELVIENITVENAPEPARHEDQATASGLDGAETDAHEAHAAEIAAVVEELGAELAALRELVVAHGSAYHMTEEDGRRWQEMNEIAELRERLSTVERELAEQRSQNTPTSESPSASSPPPQSPPESPSPPASATPPAASSPGSSAPSAESAAAPELASARALDVAVQEAPPVENARPSRGKKTSEKRFRRSLGRTAPR